jgi:hypothetical protein
MLEMRSGLVTPAKTQITNMTGIKMGTIELHSQETICRAMPCGVIDGSTTHFFHIYPAS